MARRRGIVTRLVDDFMNLITTPGRRTRSVAHRGGVWNEYVPSSAAGDWVHPRRRRGRRYRVRGR